MTYISEKYQLGMLMPYLRDNFDQYVPEAEIYSIPIDIVAIDDDDVVSIELKSRDHKKGIAQGKRNTAYCDYSYLCVWQNQVTEFLQDRIGETSLGLLAVDEDVVIIQEAERLDPNPYAKEVALEVFEDDV